MNYRDLCLSLVEALVRSQVEPGQRPAPEAGRGAPAQPPLTITLSREAGARGSSVATAVGRRLDWPVYDREILDKIAEELRRPPAHLEGVDERPFSWLEEALVGLLGGYGVSGDVYLKYLIGTVRGLGAMGQCVIVGRGANFILPAETTLRVRLVAGQQDRVRVVAQRLEISAREAAGWVESTDRQRAAFIRRYFGQDVTDAHHYDLVLNTSRLCVDEAADVIVGMVRRFDERGTPVGTEQGLLDVAVGTGPKPKGHAVG